MNARRCLPILSVLLATLGPGCDDVRYRTRGPATPGSGDQTGTVRTLLPPDALADLYRVVRPDGLSLEEDARLRDIDGHRVRLGPVEQTIPVARWQSSAEGNSVGSSLELDKPNLVVPLRLVETAPPRICRVRVKAAEWRVETSLKVTAPDAWKLSPDGASGLTPRRERVDFVGDCPPLTSGSDGDPSSSLRQTILAYVHGAVRGAAARTLELAPFDAAGLLRHDFRLDHESPLRNRRGAVDFQARTPPDGFTLGSQGLRGRWAFDISPTRARCAPPVPSQQPDSSPVAPIPANALAGTDAELAFGLSRSLLARLAQSFALAGGACRGHGASRPTNGAGSLPVSEARFETVGLGDVPVTGQIRPATYPGGLPAIELQARSRRITITWRDLVLELYGDVDGAPAQVAELEVTATITLRPTVEESRRLQLEVESIGVDEAELSSPWWETNPEPETLTRWARRLLLVVFEDQFTFPAPVRPSGPARMASVRVRSGDLLLLLDVDKP